MDWKVRSCNTTRWKQQIYCQFFFMTVIHVKRFVLNSLPTRRMIGHENKAWRHHRTCVTNVMFALREPRAVLCLGGYMHDCAYSLSTTSTPCAYLHTQSCLVSVCLKTSSLLFEIQSLSCLFAATCVSHQCWLYFSPSASLRRRGRDLRVSCVWCYSLKGQSEICELKSYPKTALVHM